SGATASALRAYAKAPTTNGLTVCRMRLHMAFAGYGTCGPFATSAIRTRLHLPRTTRLVLRTSMAGSDRLMAGTVQLCPEAEAELLAMPADIRARFLHVAELLQAFGPRQVGMPHVRHLEDKLWEMRMKGRDGIARAVYVARRGNN
ncbi:MAG: type II toxin-antitoxin system RelE/ParE family toxin, partial [Pseudomonadota bacterium]|nr:type II toxin-antitoxin system RelE/ParE family toxin [Pseudomonadota bacterium]